MKQLPLGLSDFKILIDDNYYYIDKSLLIKEIYETAGQVILLPRPRRFGKTLNLSMLKYFFEKTEKSHGYLFENTHIWKHNEYRQLQGQYPVIYLSFKDTKEVSWNEAYEKIIKVISAVFDYHSPSINSEILASQLVKYDAIKNGLADKSDYSESLKMLSELLFKSTGKRVIILIDEYDAPIHAGYTNNYYHEITSFMRSLLSATLKDNSCLERGILSGILRTAKEGLFSGLNNLLVYTILDTEFEDKFGFTQREVQQLLKDWDLEDQLPSIQTWYNGYQFGNTTVYNPWSLLSCVNKKGLLKPYWVNTSDNSLIKKLISSATNDVKEELEMLLHGEKVEKAISEAVIFPGIENNSNALWSLLLFSGYVTYKSCKLILGKTYCNLTIPNQEIRLLYHDLITEIFEETLTTSKVSILLQSLTSGDTHTFGILLQEFFINSISMYDLPATEPEKSYHLFVLGLLILLADHYQVKSNRESGLGRYDIMLIPKDVDKLGIIIEFKKATLPKESLELVAKKALALNITTCVFDRGGNLYHGRIKAVAEGARAGGLQF